MEKTLFLPQAQNSALFAVLGSPWGWLALYLAAVNLAAFLFFGLDKWKARRSARGGAVRRVPEKTLFLLAAAGGSLGALLGMRVFHHKTLHRSFRLGIPAILAAQLALAGASVWFFLLRK